MLAVTCGLGSGNKWRREANEALTMTTSIRLVADGGGAPTFDANGGVWGRLELFVGLEWVTLHTNGGRFGNEEAEVGCRQLGNELGYTPTSSSVVDYDDTPDGSGEQVSSDYPCNGSEDELFSCNDFYGWNSHQYDIGLRCTFVVAGDECEECPAGKYRYLCLCVCMRGEDGMGRKGGEK